MGPWGWPLMRISAVRMRRVSGWGGAGGGEGEFAAGAGFQVEGLEGVGSLPAIGTQEAGFETDGAFGVVAEEEAVGAGFAGLDGAQVGGPGGPTRGRLPRRPDRRAGRRTTRSLRAMKSRYSAARR